jgi:hypothetical protein
MGAAGAAPQRTPKTQDGPRGAGRGWSTPRAFSEPFSVPSGPITELNRPPEDAAHSDTGS